MNRVEYLVKNYDKKRMPFEDRGKEYDLVRKRQERKRELKYVTEMLINECKKHKRLQLTKYQEDRVNYLVDSFCNRFKYLHAKAKKETIILAFIFFVKLNEDSRIKLGHYQIASKYDLTNDVFEIIICRLLEYFMRRMPLKIINTDRYDHEILLKERT